MVCAGEASGIRNSKPVQHERHQLPGERAILPTHANTFLLHRTCVVQVHVVTADAYFFEYR